MDSKAKRPGGPGVGNAALEADNSEGDYTNFQALDTQIELFPPIIAASPRFVKTPPCPQCHSCAGYIGAACDHFFAWMEDEHCFGTLVEIGYAAALKKPIAIGSPFTIPDSGELWFALQCAQTRLCSKSPNDAVRAWLDWLVEYEGITPEGVAA